MLAWFSNTFWTLMKVVSRKPGCHVSLTFQALILFTFRVPIFQNNWFPNWGISVFLEVVGGIYGQIIPDNCLPYLIPFFSFISGLSLKEIFIFPSDKISILSRFVNELRWHLRRSFVSLVFIDFMCNGYIFYTDVVLKFWQIGRLTGQVYLFTGNHFLYVIPLIPINLLRWNQLSKSRLWVCISRNRWSLPKVWFVFSSDERMKIPSCVLLMGLCNP